MFHFIKNCPRVSQSGGAVCEPRAMYEGASRFTASAALGIVRCSEFDLFCWADSDDRLCCLFTFLPVATVTGGWKPACQVLAAVRMAQRGSFSSRRCWDDPGSRGPGILCWLPVFC